MVPDKSKQKTYVIVFAFLVLLTFITLSDQRGVTGEFAQGSYPEKWVVPCEDPVKAAEDLANEIESYGGNEVRCEKACQYLAVGSAEALQLGPLSVSFAFDEATCPSLDKALFNSVCQAAC